jgi:HAD superfamily hydrolase (TIGR01549 family)
MIKLVLFDIDYTLIKIKVVGRFLPGVVKEVIGCELSMDNGYLKTKVAGKTDREIFTSVLKECRLSKKEIEKKLDLVFKRYIKAVREGLEKNLEKNVLPGVRELLERLKKEKMVVGIITGNMKEIAKIKLKRSGLWRYFQVFGFGGETKTRSDVVEDVVKKAERKFHKRFEGKDIVIIGDTPHDIECAKPLGAKTIAVLTGPYPFEELKKRRPDHLLEDLTETEKIVSIIKNSK